MTVSGECADNSDCVSGQRIAVADEGVVVFDSVRVNTVPGNYSLKLFAEGVDVVTKPFSIRTCRPGEFNVTDQRICSACVAGKYSFLPKVECRDCDAHAVCSGGAALVPKDSYWHSSPFSTQFHKCLVEEACAYEDGSMTREEVLDSFYKNLSQGQVESVKESGRQFSNEEYKQCTKVRCHFRNCGSDVDS